jgi:hypothetical protein
MIVSLIFFRAEERWTRTEIDEQPRTSAVSLILSSSRSLRRKTSLSLWLKTPRHSLSWFLNSLRVASSQVFECPDKRFLSDLLGVLHILRHPVGQVEEGLAVGSHQRLKSVGLSGEDHFDQGFLLLIHP